MSKWQNPETDRENSDNEVKVVDEKDESKAIAWKSFGEAIAGGLEFFVHSWERQYYTCVQIMSLRLTRCLTFLFARVYKN